MDYLQVLMYEEREQGALLYLEGSFFPSALQPDTAALGSTDLARGFTAIPSPEDTYALGLIAVLH